MSIVVLIMAVAQSANAVPASPVKATDFGACVMESAVRYAKSAETADIVVEAAIAKCRPTLERYVLDAPAGTLAALPDAQEQTRKVLIKLAREDAFVRVLEIRSR